MIPIYSGSLAPRIRLFCQAGYLISAVSLCTGAPVYHHYQQKYQKFTWRQGLTGAVSLLTFSLGLLNRKLGSFYVTKIYKTVNPINGQISYLAGFSNGFGKDKLLPFHSSDILIPLNPPNPFTAIQIHLPKDNNDKNKENKKLRNVFINSDDMSYYDYKEMLQDAFKEKLPKEIAENWKEEANDDEFKALLGEMDKLKKEVKSKKEKEQEEKRHGKD